MRAFIRYVDYITRVEFVNPVHKFLCVVMKKFCHIDIKVHKKEKEGK